MAGYDNDYLASSIFGQHDYYDTGCYWGIFGENLSRSQEKADLYFTGVEYYWGEIYMKHGLVSVIIPTYNRADCLERLVKSVINSDYERKEIIVVDNNSTDNTYEVMMGFKKKRWACEIKYIRANANVNASGGRFLGGRYADGEYLFFLDDDNEMLPNTISELVKFSSKHRNAGLIAPFSLISDDLQYIQNIGVRIDLITSRCISRNSSPVKISKIDKRQRYYTNHAMNAFMVTRKAYLASGGWDPNIGIMFDESDLGVRIKKAGYQGYFAPEAKVIHYGAKFETENDELRAMGMGTKLRGFYFGRNRNLFMRRHAPFIGKIIYFLIFMHAFSGYYFMVALKNRRIDIAFSYLKGVVYGCFCPIEIRSKIDVKDLIIDEYIRTE